MTIPAGLCSACRHCQPIDSPRGSVFHLCRLALTDKAYKKYPPLPVLACPGFQQ